TGMKSEPRVRESVRGPWRLRASHPWRSLMHLCRGVKTHGSNPRSCLQTSPSASQDYAPITQTPAHSTHRNSPPPTHTHTYIHTHTQTHMDILYLHIPLSHSFSHI